MCLSLALLSFTLLTRELHPEIRTSAKTYSRGEIGSRLRGGYNHCVHRHHRVLANEGMK